MQLHFTLVHQESHVFSDLMVRYFVQLVSCAAARRNVVRVETSGALVRGWHLATAHDVATARQWRHTAWLSDYGTAFHSVAEMSRQPAETDEAVTSRYSPLGAADRWRDGSARSGRAGDLLSATSAVLCVWAWADPPAAPPAVTVWLLKINKWYQLFGTILSHTRTVGL